MNRAHTPDKSPAIAFDNVQEVELMQIALRSYKIEHGSYHATTSVGTDLLINRIELLLDELDKVKQMFNKKG